MKTLSTQKRRSVDVQVRVDPDRLSILTLTLTLTVSLIFNKQNWETTWCHHMKTFDFLSAVESLKSGNIFQSEETRRWTQTVHLTCWPLTSHHIKMRRISNSSPGPSDKQEVSPYMDDGTKVWTQLADCWKHKKDKVSLQRPNIRQLRPATFRSVGGPAHQNQGRVLMSSSAFFRWSNEDRFLLLRQ